jgi:hypothetical protein
LKLKMTGKSKTAKWKVLNGYESYHYLIHDAMLYDIHILLSVKYFLLSVYL